uniref:Uncharacterized protein n=1 Tax=Lepeophtheirus salmonis TaxID=72036 RepID=A0A0K2U481_LEPSM
MSSTMFFKWEVGVTVSSICEDSKELRAGNGGTNSGSCSRNISWSLY